MLAWRKHTEIWGIGLHLTFLSCLGRKRKLHGQKGTELWRPTAFWELSQMLPRPHGSLNQLSSPLPWLKSGHGRHDLLFCDPMHPQGHYLIYSLLCWPLLPTSNMIFSFVIHWSYLTRWTLGELVFFLHSQLTVTPGGKIQQGYTLPLPPTLPQLQDLRPSLQGTFTR